MKTGVQTPPLQNLYKSWVSVATPCNPKTWKAEANNPQGRLATYISQLLHRHKHSHRFKLPIDNHRSDSQHQGKKEGFRTQAHFWSKVRTLPTKHLLFKVCRATSLSPTRPWHARSSITQGA